MPPNDNRPDELPEDALALATPEDWQWLADHRHHPLRRPDGSPDPDRYIKFVTEYNRFINHRRREFRPMIIRDMKF